MGCRGVGRGRGILITDCQKAFQREVRRAWSNMARKFRVES